MIKLGSLSEEIVDILKDNEAVNIHGGALPNTLALTDFSIIYDPSDLTGTTGFLLRTGTDRASLNLAVFVPRIPKGIS